MKICPFCENQVNEFKTDSHIIPKWMHQLSFGKQSTTYNVDLEEKRMVVAQDGLKADFICEDCEKLFAKDDQYASFVFKQVQVTPKVVNITNASKIKVDSYDGKIEALDLKGLDFKKLQKFIFSVVLREHMFQLLKGKSLLGDKHFSGMKMAYKDDQNLDDLNYPILINSIDKRDPLWATVQHPYRGKSKWGQNLLTFTGGGYEFNVVVQSHNIPEAETGFRLTALGRAIIPFIWPSNKKSAQNAIAEAKKLRRGNKKD